MIGYAGEKGTKSRARARREHLEEVFSAQILASVFLEGGTFPVPEDLKTICRVRLGEGGVLRGLWILGEKLQCGLSVQIRTIPLRQEDVEICEYLGEDLYRIDAGGGWLIAVRHADKALRILQRKGIPAAVIGTTTSGTARTVWMGDVPRYLEGP